MPYTRAYRLIDFKAADEIEDGGPVKTGNLDPSLGLLPGENRPEQIDVFSFKNDEFTIDSTQYPALHRKLTSFWAKCTNWKREYRIQTVVAEPSSELIKEWIRAFGADTPQYLETLAKWKSERVGKEITIDGFISLTEGTELPAFQFNEMFINEMFKLGECSSLVFEFYCTDLPGKGDQPITAITTNGDTRIVWLDRSGNPNGLALYPGVIYPIQPARVTRIEGEIIGLA